MPRSSSNSSQSRTTRPVAQKQKQVQVQPQQQTQAQQTQAQQTQAQQTQQVNVASSTGIFQSMKEGFGWGIGSSIARSMFGGGSASVAPAALVAPAPAPAPAPASAPVIQRIPDQSDQLIYQKCMEDTDNKHELCKQYIIYNDTTITQSYV
jgi:hypothetical protein